MGLVGSRAGSSPSNVDHSMMISKQAEMNKRMNEMKSEMDRLRREKEMINNKMSEERRLHGQTEQKVMLLETACVGAIAMGIGLFYFLSRRNTQLLHQMDGIRKAKEEMEVLAQDIRRRAKIDGEKEGWEKLTKASKDLLQVADNLAFATKHARSLSQGGVNADSVQRLVDGLDMTSSGLHKVFNKHCVKEIQANVGDKFDPSLHNAVSVDQSVTPSSQQQQQPVPGVNYISRVVEKGYVINQTILRPSTVIVSPYPIPSSDSLAVCKSLKDAAINASGVKELDLSASDDFICKNIMCEKLGGPCACKLAKFLSQTKFPQLERMSLANNSLVSIPDSVFEIKTLKSLDLSRNKLKIDQALLGKIRSLDKLEFLSIHGNEPVDKALELRDIPSLKEIVVDNCSHISANAGVKCTEAGRTSG